jgi:PP-loop superfamily ATP-utilizing enzyme
MSLERLLTLSIKDKEELAYWNELIPYMSELQKEKLYKILEAEQEELDRLEKKF